MEMVNCVIFLQILNVEITCFVLVDYVVPEPGKSLIDAYNKWRDLADGKACCDYSLHVCVTSWSDKVAEELEILAKEKGQFIVESCH